MTTGSLPTKLPEFKGYTVDFRLQEFRKADSSKKTIKFISFKTKLGRKLLQEYYANLRR